MQTRIRLEVLGIRYTNNQAQIGAYTLILGEMNSIRRIRIVIGTSEAQSIAFQLEGVVPPRPLTHDLFCAVTQEFSIQLIEILINKFDDGMFYSELLLGSGTTQKRIDARTSDAIALALRVQCPIFTTEEVLQQVGEIFEEDLKQNESMIQEKDDIDKELEKLHLQLEKAIQNENYELASSIRDEIQRKEQTVQRNKTDNLL